MNAETASAKYIFLDVVGFTSGRSVEAQTEIVSAINEIVRSTLVALDIVEQDTVLIPTGDGLCISILDRETPYDLHLTVALQLLKRVEDHRALQNDRMRQFAVRIGLNENVDNVVIDINGRRNVAGAGISLAARIMDLSDGGQVLVGQTVCERLRHRERYMQSFRPYRAVVKHGAKISVYQYITDSPGLDTSEPQVFRKRQSKPEKLPLMIAYYLAHAIQNRSTLLKYRTRGDEEAVTVLLWFRAKDSVAVREAGETGRFTYQTLGAPTASFEEQIQLYDELPFSVPSELAQFIAAQYLERISELFEDRLVLWGARFVNRAGTERLIAEWPDIADEFGITVPPLPDGA